MAKKKGKSTKSSGGKGPVQAWIILLILLVGGVGAYLYLKPTRVNVPDLVGKSRLESEQILQGLSLKVEVRQVASTDESVASNQVLEQTPAAGTEVPPGSVVTLMVADKPGGIVLPEVIGKTRSEAEDTLIRLGLKVTFVEKTSQSVAIGRVISQDPAPGASSLSKGDVVSLTISGGKGEQTVPDLRELTPEFARERLKELGLELSVSQVAQPGFKEGDKIVILRQEPPAGAKLPVGSRVTVFIPIPVPDVQQPNNPSSTSVHAPRLEGLTLGQAKKLAAANGIALELADSADEAAVITFQDPPPGDPLPKSNPAVVVETVKSAVVPGLAGMSEKEAKAEVKRADLTIGSVKKSYGPVAGEVLGQRPTAGIEVTAGSSVDLVIADPSLSPDSANNPVPVPTPAFTAAPWVE